MSITSIPIIVPGKRTDGVYARFDATVSITDCDFTLAFVLPWPISLQAASAFEPTIEEPDCIALLTALGDI